MPCTLKMFAESTGLTVETLLAHGATECRRNMAPAVRLPYLDERGEARGTAVCLHAPNGAIRGRWDRADVSSAYGLGSLLDARRRGEIVLVDSEVDAMILHERGVPALAMAASDSEVPWDDLGDDVARIFVPIPAGAELPGVLANVPASAAERIVLLRLAVHPSVLDLHRDEGVDWQPAWARLVSEGLSWGDHLSATNEAARLDARSKCELLVGSPNLLAEFGEALKTTNFAGDTGAAKLLFLVVVSRLLDRPVSAAVKGPSGAGKSHLVKQVLKFLPDQAFHALTAMTDKALVYDREPLQHRVLVIQEAAGLGNTANLIVRSLLSEGRIDYQTVQSIDGELQAVRIVREGPTSLITTTTDVLLHRENETRVVSLTVADTEAQTREVMRALARNDEADFDAGPWHALQDYLALGDARVDVPFSGVLADATEVVAVRMRRDFSTVLGLVRTSALLHQEHRRRDDKGRLVATFDDYEIVRELLEALLAEGLERTVPAPVQDVVRAVGLLYDPSDDGDRGVTVMKIAQHLKRDRSTVQRQVAVALEREYVRNVGGSGRGQTKLIAPGESLPEAGAKILPSTHTLRLLCDGANDVADGRQDRLPNAQTENGDVREPGLEAADDAEEWPF